ncbi:4988_t:CDS:1, partial [Ambispora leptoticha]
MGDLLTRYHLENIQKHRRTHLNSPSLAISVIQTIAPDLTCTQCYPITLTLRGRFKEFWDWYSQAYNATTYSQATSSSFYQLVNTDRAKARLAIRNIIFSCQYREAVPNPRSTAQLILRKHTSFHNLNKASSAYINHYDIFIDNPTAAQSYLQTLYSDEEQQTTEETTTPILPPSSPDTIIRIGTPVIASTSTATPTRTTQSERREESLTPPDTQSVNLEEASLSSTSSPKFIQRVYKTLVSYSPRRTTFSSTSEIYQDDTHSVITETPSIVETASVHTAEEEVITSTTSLDQDYQPLYPNIKTSSPRSNRLYQKISSSSSTYSPTYSSVYPQLPGITTSPIHYNQEETNFDQTESKNILEQNFLPEQTNLTPPHKSDSSDTDEEENI